MNKRDTYVESTDFSVPDRMQAVVAAGRGLENVHVREVPVPETGPDQLLCRVDAAGVCTSILKLVAQGGDHSHLQGWDPEKWPIILGDEGAVTVVRVGTNLVDRYRVGQRLAVQPSAGVPPILHRERYRNNAEGVTGCAVGYTLGGHLAQYLCIQEEILAGQSLLPLPDPGMPYFAVSMAEPISCVYSAQERNYHILKDGPHAPRRASMGPLRGGVCVVIGAGAMGRMHAELALRFEPAALIVADLIDERLARAARTLGAKAAERNARLLCVTGDRLADTVKDVSGGRGADDVIVAVGVRPVQQEALGLLAEGGVANLFGGLARGNHMLELDSLDVHYREIKVVGSSGGDPSDMAATLDAIHQGDIDPGNYIAGVGSLDNAVDVLRMIKDQQIDGKAILYPHVGRTPLRRVETWSRGQEDAFLEERL